MVGVAGRSKGCNTCRKRKKGCDLQRPECGRCLKAGLVCSGYERERVFVHYPPPDESQPTAEGATAASPGASSTCSESTTVATASTSTSDIVLPPSLVRSAREDKYIGLFWDSYIPDRRRFLGTLARYSYANSWVPAMRSLQQNDLALHKIMIALCVGTLGRESREEWMQQESSKLYLGALQEMNVALRTPSRRKSDAVLLATRVFGLYDLVCGVVDGDASGISPAASWQGHNLGQLNLILQRKPEEYTEGIAHSLFVEGRMTMTIMAIASRKRLALSNSEWKTIPWRKVHKTSKDIIFDIMGDVAGILNDFDRVGTLDSLSARKEGYAEVARHCWLVDTSLTQWYDNIGPGDHMTAIIERGGLELPTSEHVAVAYIMSHYWTASLLLYATLRLSLSLSVSSSKPSSSSTSSSAMDALRGLPERVDPRIYCKSIIEASDVLHHPSSGAFGAHSVVFPLSMAASYMFAVESGDGTEEVEASLLPEMRKLLSVFNRDEAGMKLRRLMYAMFRNTDGARKVLERQQGSADQSDIQEMAAHARVWFGIDREEGLEAVAGRLLC